MKTILLATTMLLSVIAFAHNGTPVEASAPNPIKKATAAIKAACSNAQGKLNYSVQAVSACFVDGFIQEVTFWKTPNCPGNQPCIQTVEMVGVVTLDCSGNVISVSCETSEI